MPTTTTSTSSLFDSARALQIWGFPVIFAQRLRLRFTAPLTPHVDRPATSAGAAVNEMGHQRRLSDPSLTAGVAPNVDTRYSLAFIDLDSGPFELRLPDFADRYWSAQIGEADSTTAAVLGRRTHGSRAPSLRLTRVIADGSAPRPTTEAETTEIRCRSRFVMIAIRILVDPSRPDDSSRVTALQDQITLVGPPTHTAPVDRSLVLMERSEELGDPRHFLQSLVCAISGLSEGDVPRWVLEEVKHLQGALADDSDHRDADETVAHGLAAGLAAIAEHVTTLGRAGNGWAINDSGTDFGDDHLLRAAVAYSQIYINPATEALYPVCERDHRGDRLSGAHRYTITFAADDMPPADFFWSLTVYHAQGLLYDNEIQRYAVTDRTPDLRRGDDGSLTVSIQTDRPSRNANWLPCPPGHFRLMLRLYGPNRSSWTPPPVIASDGSTLGNESSRAPATGAANHDHT